MVKSARRIPNATVLGTTALKHEAVRGKGTFERALAALGHARRAGFRVVEAVTCARPANLGGLEELESRVREAGAGQWRLITVDRMGRGRQADDLWLRPAGVRRLLDFVEERRSAHLAADDGFDVRFSCGGFLGVSRELAVRPGNGQCFAGLSIASILCDGQVGACPSMPRDWAQGSARRKRFSTIWKTRFERYRDLAWRREGVCAECSWFAICRGGGLHERLVQPEEFCWLDRQDP